MSCINDEQDRNIIEEQAATIRLLTDLTKAGSWVIHYAADGSVASVQWGEILRADLIQADGGGKGSKALEIRRFVDLPCFCLYGDSVTGTVGAVRRKAWQCWVHTLIRFPV